jgi:hypothetical protein
MTLVHADGDAKRARAYVAAAVALGLAGASLAMLGWAADRNWLDRHFLPSFYLPRMWYVRIHGVARWFLMASGVSLILIARRAAVRARRGMLRTGIPIAVAAVFAVMASEIVLRFVHLRPAGWLVPDEEPRRQPDPLTGWILEAGRTGRSVIAGRTIEYTIDASGCRVRNLADPVDPTRSTVIFIGESVMFGEGLTWEESVPAQVARILGVQSANLAVHGYSTDQAFLRLKQELPQFPQPVGVVALFMPALFGRNLDDDRPHLGPGLVWLPPQNHGRLLTLAGLAVPYRRDETVERGIAVTREVLRAVVELAAIRGSTPLIVVPQFGAEEPIERTLRGRILDDGRLPYVFVEIESTWRLPWDRHPNAAAAYVIARAIAERLRGEWVGHSSTP